MLVGRWIGLGAMLVALLSASGCGRVEPGAPNVVGSEQPAPTAADGSGGSPAAETQGGAVSSPGGQGGAAATPAAQGGGDAAQGGGPAAPGQSAAGPAADDPGGAEGGEQSSGPMTTYTDSTYGFRVDHPADFELRPRAAEYLGSLMPSPVAALAILSPTRAASALGDMEAPDLEVRVHDAGGAATVEGWLAANQLIPAAGGAALPAFQTATLTGVELCGDTMLAPGCSYYFMGAGRVYQLIPATIEGEAMLGTFALQG